ncbi:MAG: GtrA family protein [Fusobacteriaceae bacterium]
MNRLAQIIQKKYKKNKTIINYGGISILVTVIDVFVSRFLESYTSIILANTLGVISGFIIQFFLTSKYVFRNKSRYAFFVFFLTFLFGLLLANAIVYVVRVVAFNSGDTLLSFAFSKAFSIVIPFFIIYIVRKKLILEEKRK